MFHFKKKNTMEKEEDKSNYFNNFFSNSWNKFGSIFGSFDKPSRSHVDY